MLRSRAATLVGICGLAISLVTLGCNATKKAASTQEPVSTGLARFQNAQPIPQAGDKRAAERRDAAKSDLASMARQSALDIEALRTQRSDIAPTAGPSNDDAQPQAFAAADDAPSIGLRRAAARPRPAPVEPAPMPVSRAAASEHLVDTSAADREWAVLAGVAPAQPAPAPGAPSDTPLASEHASVAAWMRASDLMDQLPAAAGMLGVEPSWSDDDYNQTHRVSVDDLMAIVTAHAENSVVSAPLAPIESPLKLGTTAFCTRVESFGKYDAIARDTFPSGVPLRVLVYTEIEKFTDRETSDGQRAVELSQTLALVQDATGSEIWSVPAQTITETSRRSRRDFYLVQQIELPQNLALGTYRLRVSVTDQSSKATDERWIPFSVTADGRAAMAR